MFKKVLITSGFILSAFQAGAMELPKLPDIMFPEDIVIRAKERPMLEYPKMEDLKEEYFQKIASKNKIHTTIKTVLGSCVMCLDAVQDAIPDEQAEARNVEVINNIDTPKESVKKLTMKERRIKIKEEKLQAEELQDQETINEINRIFQ